jgi:tungstate transport system substrate-binding protein
MKKLLFVTILALVTVAALACAPAPTQSPPTAAPKPTEVPVAKPTSAPTAAPKPTEVPAAKPTSAPTAAPTPTSIRAVLSSGCHLILSTTTSTADSGLLAFILPDYEKKSNCKVDVVAVGTGQAMQIGQRGDADVLLVHDRAREDQFVKDGNTKERFDVMYNDFVVVGPKNDPAKIAGMTMGADALKAIANTKAAFMSRGDGSGTHAAEMRIWASVNISPTKDLAWYNSLGQGMGETLLSSNEKGAYTIADRGTWLSMTGKLPNLVVLVGGNDISQNKDAALFNPYGLMAVNPDKFKGINVEKANEFVKWMLSVETQKMIGSYKDKTGQILFYPDSKEYKSSMSTGSAALTLTGAVDKEQKLTLAALKGMTVVKLNLEHPKTGKQDYEGVRLNALLDAAQVKTMATRLILAASDGFTSDVALADVRKCADCLIAFSADGSLTTAMPGMASNTWVKNLVKIEVK